MPMRNFKAYYQFVKPYRLIIAVTLLVGMVKFAIPLFLPLMLQYTIDDIALTDLPLADKLHKLGYVLAAGIALFVVLRGPVEYYRQYFAQMAVSRILFDIRNKLYEHMQRLSLRFYQNRKTGEIISRMINDVEQTKNLVEVGLMNIWLDLFSVVFVVGVMFYFDPALTLAAIAVIPLYAVAVKILYKQLRVLTKERSQALADMQAYLHERIQGIPVIRSFVLERHETGWFGRRNRKFLDKALAHTRWNALTFSVINTLTDIAPLAVLGYGAYLVIIGRMELGVFAAFFALLDRLYGPLRRLVNASTTLTQASASLERMTEFMDEPYDITDSPHAEELLEPRGGIAFEGVSFAYRTGGQPVLRDIRLVIRPGETVALVGPSGGGKSSLVSLIPRFYDIDQGVIRFDGRNIAELTQTSLRSQIGMVLQDNILFSGSVRDNIMMGRPEATETEMKEAAEAANASGFIEALPHGYDTEIGERGVKLSGGQKQRIAIARVFLKNPKVLILDEATSALDLESERLVRQSLELLAKNRTTIIVAHRLSTITHADNIVVIEGGRIRESGRHDELMAAGGVYHRLFTIQEISKTSD